MKLISNKIVKILTKKKLTLSFAESCTGGLLSGCITSISGSSKVFRLGLVTYSNKSKNTFLKVPKKILTKYGAVSEKCCESMVKNLSKIGKSSLSLSITGIAGPNGGSAKKPVGLVYIGFKKGSKIKINRYLFKNKNRNYIRNAAVKQSLRLILSSIK